MKKNACSTGRSSLSFALAILFVVVVAGAGLVQSAAAQQREIGPSKPATPEINSVSPQETLPVKSLEVVMTGHNLRDGTPAQLKCHDMEGDRRLSGPGHEFTAGPVTVKTQGDKRAVATFTLPSGHPEAKCELDAIGAGGVTLEIRITEHFKLEAVFLTEGNLASMDVSTKSNEAMIRYVSGKDQFMLGPDSLKYVKDGKDLFQQPYSNIKSVDKLTIKGQEFRSFFKITFQDGKVYSFVNFGSAEKDPCKMIQARLKK